MTPVAPDKTTILMVDDNLTNLDVLFSYLDQEGYKILVAENGLDALERAKQARPHLILLDVMMPDMDGFETCRRLKQLPEVKDIPVLFMTILADIDSKVKAFEAGGVDYITKPFQYEEVLARITTHLTLRNLQQALEDRAVELQAHVAELDAFASTVAHDLKNPVTKVLGYADLMQLKRQIMSQEDRDQAVARIADAARQMNRIINALLLLARVRQTDVTLEPVDMAVIVADVQDQLAGMIQTYQPEIKQPAGWPPVLGYAPWVEAVWTNYISNALKYGGTPPCLELGATPQPDGMVRFWVRDNGPGLSAAEQASLFTPFTRLHQGRAQGHGLGLSIVQRIIEKLGGQAGVESEGRAGQGSVFSFTLPAF